MAQRCFEGDCREHIQLHTYESPLACEAGHRLTEASDRVQRFFERATSEVNA